jgi:hypothetical protein
VNLPADPAALRATIVAMQTPAWADAWRMRLRKARWANLDSVKRTIAMMLDLAAARHAAGDADGFRSWAAFTLDHASGRNWDETACRRSVAGASD